MNRHLVTLRVTVKDGERALLTRSGRLERMLAPGRHRLFDPLHQLDVELHNVVRGEIAADRYAAILAARPDIAAEAFTAVETRGGEVAIVSLDGRPAHVIGPWQVRVYWKVATRVDVERIDVAGDPLVSPRHLAMVERTRLARSGADGRHALVAVVAARASPRLRERDRGREPRGACSAYRGPVHAGDWRRAVTPLDGRSQGRGEAPDCGRLPWRSRRGRC